MKKLKTKSDLPDDTEFVSEAVFGIHLKINEQGATCCYARGEDCLTHNCKVWDCPFPKYYFRAKEPKPTADEHEEPQPECKHLMGTGNNKGFYCEECEKWFYHPFKPQPSECKHGEPISDLKSKLLQIVLEDVPHKYQDRLLKALKEIR